MKKEEAAIYAMNNRDMLNASKKAGCFHCCSTFNTSEVKLYTDQNKTAICPKCGIDAVLGDRFGLELSENFLQEARDYWFAKPKDKLTPS
jgi:hypothetical protein